MPAATVSLSSWRIRAIVELAPAPRNEPALMANVDQPPLVRVLQAEVSQAGLLTLGLDARLPHL